MSARYRVRYHRQILSEDGRLLFRSGEIVDDIEKVPSAQRDRLALIETDSGGSPLVDELEGDEASA